MSKIPPITPTTDSILVNARDGPAAGTLVRVWATKPQTQVLCASEMHWYDREGWHHGQVLRGDRKGR